MGFLGRRDGSFLLVIREVFLGSVRVYGLKGVISIFGFFSEVLCFY